MRQEEKKWQRNRQREKYRWVTEPRDAVIDEKRWRDKERGGENENSRMRGRWRRDGARDWEEIGHEEDEKSVNRKLKPRIYSWLRKGRTVIYPSGKSELASIHPLVVALCLFAAVLCLYRCEQSEFLDWKETWRLSKHDIRHFCSFLRANSWKISWFP